MPLPPEPIAAAPGRVASRRPQFTADELHQLRWLLGNVLTLLAVGTVFYMDVDAWTLMALTSSAAIAALVRPTLPARVPRFVHTFAFPAIVTFFAADVWLRSELLPAMVRLDMLLLLYRTISYRQRRDDLQIIILGLFLIVIAGVLTVSLTFAAQILFYTGCALGFLLIITLTDPAPANAAPPGSPVVAGAVPPAWAVHTNWPHLFRRLREVANWRVLGFGVVLFAGVVGVSALLFLAIPRFQFESSMLLDRFISKKAKSGFNDTIRFGDVTDIQQDNSVALSVDVSDQSQIPGTPYWRMLVLDSYEQGTFRLSSRLRLERFDQERTASFLVGRAIPRPGPTVFWTFFLESGVSRYLPLLGHFEKIRFREPQNFRGAATLALVALRGDPVTMTAYQVEDFDLSGSVRDETFSERWRNRAQFRPSDLSLELRLTDDDKSALERHLNEITGGERLPAMQTAQRISAWLRGNHEYSLTPRIPSGERDPLLRWLGARGPGHCELFAGSFVLLARTAGFPARVVTGFKGGSWNAYSNNFTIRNSDAHAWGEIFDPETGTWLRADALGAAAGTQAEEARGQAAISARMDRSWTARLDSLRVFWYRRIVSFDQRSQVETLRAVKDATQNSGKRMREALERALAGLKGWAMAPWNARRFIKVLGAMLGIVLFGWLWFEFGRAWWRTVWQAGGGRGGDPVRREASQWLRQIAAAEVRRGALDAGRANGPAGPGRPDVFAAVVRELQRLRFGARETWPSPHAVFRRARQALRAYSSGSYRISQP
ncbi:MAG: DUF3488 and transglutaminase-like domain-containing protein [Opitutaceae bacterium]|nr:DUF3488 and transglutaminase-like domain-containing protein [Opitutaceae bacterium]